MTTQEQIQTIKEVCMSANPKAEWLTALSGPTLATVLIVINKNRKMTKWYAIDTNGIFLHNKVEEITAKVYENPMISTGYSWDLLKDDITWQSSATINFIYELLHD